MRFLCFPHYTAGGLLCDIFEQKFSQVGPHGGIVSLNHQLGKIGDSDSIFVDFDTQQFNDLLLQYQYTDTTVGTHCWPGNVSIPGNIEVILITTETTKSKIYRWLRAWHLYFSKTDIVNNLSGIDFLDKQRELAKNYLKPFPVVPNAVNLEFADIVETTAEFYNVINNLPAEQHLKRWKEINQFLYDPNLWNNELVKRYHEAEFEIAHERHYRYN